MSRHNEVPEHVNDNIEKIVEVRHGVAKRMNRHQRAVERATLALARPRTLYVLLLLGSSWILYNTQAVYRHWHVFDTPPFFWLQGACSVYAALVATMVLSAQSRQRLEWEQRAHLELQVNLLSEQKATKIIALLEELRRDLPMVANREDLVAVAMQQRVDPQAVLSVLENAMGDRFAQTPTPSE